MIKVELEPFEFVYEELRPLFEDNWRKLAMGMKKVPTPNYDAYIQCERIGSLRLLVARDGDRPVGYWMEFCFPSLQDIGRIRAYLDTWGVKNGYETKVPLPLMKAVERMHEANNVDDSFVGSRNGTEAGRLYEAFGYRPIETMYVKTYKEGKA